MTIEQSFEHLGLLFQPAPLLIYKPSKNVEKGNAAKFELSLRPEFHNGYLTNRIQGGLFLQIVGQTGFDANENASFDWQGKNGTSVQVKLGLLDVQEILAAFRAVREEKGVVPVAFQASRAKNPEQTLGIFHKFSDSTSIIQVEFKDAGTIWGVSKSAEQRRRVAISLTEEIGVLKYLEHALWAFLLLGER